MGAEREGAEHVDAAAHAAIDEHGRAFADRGNDVRQRRRCRRCAIELATAMVRHDHGVGPGIDRLAGVVGIEQAFQHDPARPACAQPRKIGPGHGRVELRIDEATEGVEIARALATRPSFMLLDEPFAGIDPKAIEDIRDLILYLKGRGIGILITDHNVREMLDIVDRASIIYEGQVLFEGSPDEVTANEDVRRVYLGERYTA